MEIKVDKDFVAFLAAKDAERFELRHQEAIALVEANPKIFDAKFAAWLQTDWHIFIEFERRANDMIAVGVKHYGAKGIWETIRYHTTMADTSGEFKLNNNWHAPCARLFVTLNPIKKDFFEFRCRPSTHRKAEPVQEAAPAQVVEENHEAMVC